MASRQGGGGGHPRLRRDFTADDDVGDPLAGVPQAATVVNKRPSRFAQQRQQQRKAAAPAEPAQEPEPPQAPARSVLTGGVVERSEADFSYAPPAARERAFPDTFRLADAAAPVLAAPVRAPAARAPPAAGPVSPERAEIDRENREVLSRMSREEIEREQAELAAQLPPGLVAKLTKKKQKEEEEQQKEEQQPPPPPREQVVQPPVPEAPARAGIDFQGLYLTKEDSAKLEWTQPVDGDAAEPGQPSVRFDFDGRVVAADADVPVHQGLHHHGEEPGRAGYTIPEILMLVRSSVPAQQTAMLGTLAAVMRAAKRGLHTGTIDTLQLLSEADAGVVVRLSLDSQNVNIVSAAVDALHAMLCNPEEDAFLAGIEPLFRGHEQLPLASAPFYLDEDQLDRDEPNDEAAAMRRDLIEGLLRTDLLQRLRYLLEVLRVPRVDAILEILVRIGRHSLHAADAIHTCPRLVALLVNEFVATADAHPLAIRALRMLVLSGRGIADQLFRRADGELLDSLHRHVLGDNIDSRCFVEAILFFRAGASYGFHTDVFDELVSARAAQGMTGHIALLLDTVAHRGGDRDASGESWRPVEAFLPALGAAAVAPDADPVTRANAIHCIASFFQHLQMHPGYTASRGADLVASHTDLVVRIWERLGVVADCIPAAHIRWGGSSSNHRGLPFPPDWARDAVEALERCNLALAQIRLLFFVARLQPALLRTLPTPIQRSLLVYMADLTRGLRVRTAAAPWATAAGVWPVRLPAATLYYCVKIVDMLPAETRTLDAAPHAVFEAAAAAVPCFAPGDETYVGDLLSSVLFLPAHMPGVAEPLRVRSHLLVPLRETLLDKSAALRSQRLASFDGEVASLHVMARTSLLPARPDWMFAPVLSRDRQWPPSEAASALEFARAAALGLGDPLRRWYLALHLYVTQPADTFMDAAVEQLMGVFLSEHAAAGGSSVAQLAWPPAGIDAERPVKPLGRPIQAPYALASELLERFISESFGNVAFARALLALMSVRQPVDVRRVCWLQLGDSLRSLAGATLPLPIEHYTEAADTDPDMLKHYTEAVCDNALRRGHPLYPVAVAHLHADMRPAAGPLKTLVVRSLAARLPAQVFCDIWNGSPVGDGDTAQVADKQAAEQLRKVCGEDLERKGVEVVVVEGVCGVSPHG